MALFGLRTVIGVRLPGRLDVDVFGRPRRARDVQRFACRDDLQSLICEDYQWARE
jgi:hypothetical protein